MLTPKQLSNCANDIIALYQQLDERIAKDIARRIVKANYITDTANWQIKMLQECGMLQNDILTSVAQYSGISEKTLKELFEETTNTAVTYDMSIYNKIGLNPLPLNMSPRAMQTLEAGFNKTNGNLQNLTKTTAATSQTAFINACTLAEMKVSSGTFDYNTAILDAIKQVSDNGAWVQYPSGHRDRLDVAVRRNVITGIGQTTGEICLGYARDMECDLMEITAHAGARPSHCAWQGQIVSLSGRRGYLSLDDIGYGSGDGFKGWNCRHDWFPYFEGTERMYSDKDLKALEDRDIKYPDGSMHTYYEAEQRQRAYERQIRKYKRNLSAFDEAIKNTNDTEQIKKFQQEFSRQSVKLKNKEAELKNFCKQTEILQDNSRVRVVGFNRSVSQKAVQQSKKHNVKSVANSGQNGIIITGGKITDKNFMFIEKFEEQAEKFYEARINNGDTDVKLISKNTGFSYDDILAIKNHLMVDEHLFSNGSIRKFDPNIDQALAWQRLMENHFKNSDILLLNHELRELNYMHKTNCDYETAHRYATQKYDWQSVIETMVDTDNINPNLLK